MDQSVHGDHDSTKENQTHAAVFRHLLQKQAPARGARSSDDTTPERPGDRPGDLSGGEEHSYGRTPA